MVVRHKRGYSVDLEVDWRWDWWDVGLSFAIENIVMTRAIQEINDRA